MYFFGFALNRTQIAGFVGGHSPSELAGPGLFTIYCMIFLNLTIFYSIRINIKPIKIFYNLLTVLLKKFIV